MEIAPYTTIMKAAEIIAHDMGAINRLESFAPATIAVDYTEDELELVEKCLVELNAEALETVCIGEVKEANTLLGECFRTDAAKLCHKVLNSIGEVI